MIYNEFGKLLFQVFVIQRPTWNEYHIYDADGLAAIHVIPT